MFLQVFVLFLYFHPEIPSARLRFLFLCLVLTPLPPLLSPVHLIWANPPNWQYVLNVGGAYVWSLFTHEHQNDERVLKMGNNLAHCLPSAWCQCWLIDYVMLFPWRQCVSAGLVSNQWHQRVKVRMSSGAFLPVKELITQRQLTLASVPERKKNITVWRPSFFFYSELS